LLCRFLQSLAGDDLASLNPLQVAAFLLIAAAGAGLSSTFAGLSMLALGQTDSSALMPLVMAWWIGDYAGVLTVAPIFALVLARLASKLDAPMVVPLHRFRGLERFSTLWPKALVKLAILAVIAVLLLTLVISAGEPGLVGLLLALVPLQIWVARTEAELASVISVFGLTLLLAMAVSNSALTDVAVTVQFLVILLAAVGYLAAVAQRPARIPEEAALNR
jgi:hypothetical protein